MKDIKRDHRAERLQLIRTMDNTTSFGRKILKFFLTETEKPDIMYELSFRLASAKKAEFKDLYEILIKIENEKGKNSSEVRKEIEIIKIMLLGQILINPEIVTECFSFAIEKEQGKAFEEKITNLMAKRGVKLYS